MANPQVEDGFIKIANEIMDALCRIRIPGEEMQVLNTILRKTYGWGKKVDSISLSQFQESTGISKPHIVTAIKGLLLKKVIIITEKGNDTAKTYGINKDYDQWTPLPKKVTLPKKVIGITEKGNESLPKKVPTKEKKKTITKESAEFVLPDWIPQETWTAYMAVREKKRAAKTPYALNLIIKALQKIKQTHNHDPVEVLNKSITNGWTDVYPLKDGGQQNGNNIGTPKIYHRQEQVVSARQREIDAEAERLSKEYYALQAKGNASNGTA